VIRGMSGDMPRRWQPASSRPLSGRRQAPIPAHVGVGNESCLFAYGDCRTARYDGLSVYMLTQSRARDVYRSCLCVKTTSMETDTLYMSSENTVLCWKTKQRFITTGVKGVVCEYWIYALRLVVPSM